MQDGIQTQFSNYGFDETIVRLEALFKEKGVNLFCVIDHSGEAAAVGIQMPPTKVLIFGNAKAGTSLMLATPSSALDLPLKMLVAEVAEGKVMLSWNDPAWLQQRHGFPEELSANIGAVAKFAALAAS